jgi:hypothetical protein
MRLRPRLSTRKWLVVVAVAALAFGVWRDRQHRWQRDFFARGLILLEKRAVRHEQLRVFCLESAARNTPYEMIARQKDMDREPDDLEDSPTDWESEANYHAERVARIRRTAAEFAAMKRNEEQYLIFP